MSSDNLILRTVYLPPDLDDKLRVEAFAKRTSKNDLIRKYIDLGMKAASKEQDTKVPDNSDALPGSIVARNRPSQQAPVKKAARKTSAAKSAGKA